MDAKALDWYRQLPGAYVSSAVAGARRRSEFDRVGTYVMFIGHARSGSTLVGSLLNAHPDAVLAHELHALRYLNWGLRRRQLYHLITENDRRFTRSGASRTKQGYEFEVPGMWQGRHRDLRVIGDKHAGTSTRTLRTQPQLLHRLRRVTGVPVVLVHVVRNPWDNIATIAKRSERDLTTATDSYFRRCETIRVLAAATGDEEVRIVRVHHEALTGDPRKQLGDLCRSLGLEADDDYLSACAGIVFESPHRSRTEAAWPEGLVDDIARRAARFDFLAGYSFDR